MKLASLLNSANVHVYCEFPVSENLGEQVESMAGGAPSGELVETETSTNVLWTDDHELMEH